MSRPDQDEAESGGDPKQVEAAAVRLLARREHSTDELRRKLIAQGRREDIVDAVLQKLAGKRLVSDGRFAASFVHHHTQRGHGPVRIRAELRQHGVADGLIDQELRRTEQDWIEAARRARERKFGRARPRDLRERAKQARFLQYRGFSAEHIRAALSREADAFDAPDEPLPEQPD